MAKTISFTDIQERSQKKFQDIEITGIPGGPVLLAHALRLSEKKRKRLNDLFKIVKQDGDENGASESEIITEIFTITAGKEDGQRLIKAANGDMTQLAAIILEYVEASELGEASGSVSS